jgi:actin-like ATPase involved in cell morphogenesis
VIIADEPLTCVARGGGKALEMIGVVGGLDFLLKE